jgi:hypothetical protein
MPERAIVAPRRPAAAYSSAAGEGHRDKHHAGLMPDECGE